MSRETQAGGRISGAEPHTLGSHSVRQGVPGNSDRLVLLFLRVFLPGKGTFRRQAVHFHWTPGIVVICPFLLCHRL